MDKDIQEMFRRKNREILIQNLKLDIERNMDILTESLTNLFNLHFSIAIKNIFSMYDEKVPLKRVTKNLVVLKAHSFQLLDKKLQYKKDILLQKIEELEFEEEQMDVYYGLVFSTTEQVLELFSSDELDSLQKKSIHDFCCESENAALFSKEVQTIIDYRVRDYITDRLFGKLEEKVKTEIFIRDNNLSNKGKESYEKFQELEKKTTNP